jgi:hypothetical protein
LNTNSKEKSFEEAREAALAIARKGQANKGGATAFDSQQQLCQPAEHAIDERHKWHERRQGEKPCAAKAISWTLPCPSTTRRPDSACSKQN